MSRFKRIAAAGLAVSMILSISVCAAPPAVTYDESYYVNLDYYGATRTSNMVKSYSLNGQRSITDYGTYDSVQNMSNYIEPIRKSDGVVFSFGENIPDRFYFEAKTDEPLANLPWNIDLTYKLNGAPTDPATLAGAKGLVEIDLDLTPNDAAPAYFRNNMVLTATTALNYDQIYSVEAPGAQIQSLGNFKAIAFMALPGEECHFVTRLGSDSFEFGGFTFLLVPATLSQMDNIQEIRDAKETLEDSANAINKSLDVILGCMGSLSGSLNSTADGLASLEEARKVISEGKGQVYANLDQSLADLESIGTAMKPTEGDIKSAKETLAQTKKDLSALHTTSKSLKDNIVSTKKVLTGIKADTASLQDFLDDFDDSIDPVTQNLDSLTSSLDSLKTQLGHVDEVGDQAVNSQMVEVAPGVKLSVGEINSIISSMNTLYAAYQKQAPEVDFPTFAEAVLSDPPYAYDASKIKLFLGIWAKQTDIGKELAPVTSITGGLNDVASATASVIAQTSGVIKAMRHLDQELRSDYSDLGDSLLEDGETLSTEGVKVLEKLDAMIDQLDALYSTLTAYEPSVQRSLDHAATLVNILTTGTINLKTLLSRTESLLKQSGAPLDAGTEKTLKGFIDSLRQATKGLNQTGVIQNAKNTVRDTIDDQWAEYTGDGNNLLLMDTASEKPSMTSSRNAPPETIQILMRTDEISLKNQNEKATVDETYVAKGNIISRIGNIFHAIGDAVSGLF